MADLEAIENDESGPIEMIPKTDEELMFEMEEFGTSFFPMKMVIKPEFKRVCLCGWEEPLGHVMCPVCNDASNERFAVPDDPPKDITMSEMIELVARTQWEAAHPDEDYDTCPSGIEGVRKQMEQIAFYDTTKRTITLFLNEMVNSAFPGKENDALCDMFAELSDMAKVATWERAQGYKTARNLASLTGE